MLHDHVIRKPASMDVYTAHRMVEELTGGARTSFADLGDRLLVRAAVGLTPNGTALPEIHVGEVLAFELTASCGVKVKGKHRYYPVGDWRSRRAWLERRSEQCGFRIRALNVTAKTERIIHKGREISIDRTDFSGVLEVSDAEMFNATLENGVGGPARAFGRGMIII